MPLRPWEAIDRDLQAKGFGPDSPQYQRTKRNYDELAAPGLPAPAKATTTTTPTTSTTTSTRPPSSLNRLVSPVTSQQPTAEPSITTTPSTVDSRPGRVYTSKGWTGGKAVSSYPTGMFQGAKEGLRTSTVGRLARVAAPNMIDPPEWEPTYIEEKLAYGLGHYGGSPDVPLLAASPVGLPGALGLHNASQAAFDGAPIDVIAKEGVKGAALGGVTKLAGNLAGGATLARQQARGAPPVVAAHRALGMQAAAEMGTLSAATGALEEAEQGNPEAPIADRLLSAAKRMSGAMAENVGLHAVTRFGLKKGQSLRDFVRQSRAPKSEYIPPGGQGPAPGTTGGSQQPGVSPKSPPAPPSLPAPGAAPIREGVLSDAQVLNRFGMSPDDAMKQGKVRPVKGGYAALEGEVEGGQPPQPTVVRQTTSAADVLKDAMPGLQQHYMDYQQRIQAVLAKANFQQQQGDLRGSIKTLQQITALQGTLAQLEKMIRRGGQEPQQLVQQPAPLPNDVSTAPPMPPPPPEPAPIEDVPPWGDEDIPEEETEMDLADFPEDIPDIAPEEQVASSSTNLPETQELPPPEPEIPSTPPALPGDDLTDEDWMDMLEMNPAEYAALKAAEEAELASGAGPEPLPEEPGPSAPTMDLAAIQDQVAADYETERILRQGGKKAPEETDLVEEAPEPFVPVGADELAALQAEIRALPKPLPRMPDEPEPDGPHPATIYPEMMRMAQGMAKEQDPAILSYQARILGHMVEEYKALTALPPEIQDVIAGNAMGWYQPNPGEGTVPTPGEQQLAASGINLQDLPLTFEGVGVHVSKHKDTAGAVALFNLRAIDPGLVEQLDEMGRLPEIANGPGTAPKPPNPAALVHVTDPRTGQPVRDVLVAGPEGASSAVSAQPPHLTTEVLPADAVPNVLADRVPPEMLQQLEMAQARLAELEGQREQLLAEADQLRQGRAAQVDDQIGPDEAYGGVSRRINDLDIEEEDLLAQLSTARRLLGDKFPTYQPQKSPTKQHEERVKAFLREASKQDVIEPGTTLQTTPPAVLNEQISQKGSSIDRFLEWADKNNIDPYKMYEAGLIEAHVVPQETGKPLIMVTPTAKFSEMRSDPNLLPSLRKLSENEVLRKQDNDRKASKSEQLYEDLSLATDFSNMVNEAAGGREMGIKVANVAQMPNRPKEAITPVRVYLEKDKTKIGYIEFTGDTVQQQGVAHLGKVGEQMMDVARRMVNLRKMRREAMAPKPTQMVEKQEPRPQRDILDVLAEAKREKPTVRILAHIRRKAGAVPAKDTTVGDDVRTPPPVRHGDVVAVDPREKETWVGRTVTWNRSAKFPGQPGRYRGEVTKQSGGTVTVEFRARLSPGGTPVPIQKFEQEISVASPDLEPLRGGASPDDGGLTKLATEQGLTILGGDMDGAVYAQTKAGDVYVAGPSATTWKKMADKGAWEAGKRAEVTKRKGYLPLGRENQRGAIRFLRRRAKGPTTKFPEINNAMEKVTSAPDPMQQIQDWTAEKADDIIKAANAFRFHPELKEWPRIRNGVRLIQDAPLVAQERALQLIRAKVLKPLQGKLGTISETDWKYFSYIVFLRDFTSRARRGQMQAGDYGWKEYKAEADRLEGEASERVKAALKGHREMMWDTAVEDVRRNRLHPDILKRYADDSGVDEFYVSHYIGDVADGVGARLGLGGKLQVPYTPGLLRARGSEKVPDLEYAHVTMRHLTTTHLAWEIDDIFEDIIKSENRMPVHLRFPEVAAGDAKQASKHIAPVAKALTDDELAEVEVLDGVGRITKVGRTKKGEVRVPDDRAMEHGARWIIDGKHYTVYQYRRFRWKWTQPPKDPYAAQLTDFLEDTADDWDAKAKGHYPERLLLPTPVAEAITQIVRGSDPDPWHSLKKTLMVGWKRAHIDMGLLTTQYNNMLGDLETIWLTDPFALLELFRVSPEKGVNAPGHLVWATLMGKEGKKGTLLHEFQEFTRKHRGATVGTTLFGPQVLRESTSRMLKTHGRRLAGAVNPMGLVSLWESGANKREMVLRLAIGSRVFMQLKAGKRPFSQVVDTQGLTDEEAAGAIMRETLGDYGKVSGTWRSAFREGIMPFFYWYQWQAQVQSRLIRQPYTKGQGAKWYRRLSYLAKIIGPRLAAWWWTHVAMGHTREEQPQWSKDYMLAWPLEQDEEQKKEGERQFRVFPTGSDTVLGMVGINKIGDMAGQLTRGEISEEEFVRTVFSTDLFTRVVGPAFLDKVTDLNPYLKIAQQVAANRDATGEPIIPPNTPKGKATQLYTGFFIREAIPWIGRSEGWARRGDRDADAPLAKLTEGGPLADVGKKLSVGPVGAFLEAMVERGLNPNPLSHFTYTADTELQRTVNMIGKVYEARDKQNIGWDAYKDMMVQTIINAPPGPNEPLEEARERFLKAMTAAPLLPDDIQRRMESYTTWDELYREAARKTKDVPTRLRLLNLRKINRRLRAIDRLKKTPKSARELALMFEGQKQQRQQEARMTPAPKTIRSARDILTTLRKAQQSYEEAR